MSSDEPRRVVLASGNRGKLVELQRLLAPLAIEVLSQASFDVPPVEETGLTFIENALLKARNATLHAGMPAIADDSGIIVDALGGAPGIHSARFAGVDADDAANNRKLLRALEDVEPAKRTARFHCTLVYLRDATDPAPLVAEGVWHGNILSQPRGAAGFGYDPLFYVAMLDATAAELDPEVKNRESHRGRAARRLVELLRDAGEPSPFHRTRSNTRS